MTIDRLLRDSTFGWDKLPISQEDLHVYETITINYYGTRPSQEELLIQKMEIKEETRSLHSHKTVNQEKFLQKEPTNSLTKKLYLHAKEEDTVHPTDLSTLQFGRPQVPPPLQT